MKIPQKIQDNWQVAASFCAILTLMFFLFATKWDLQAIAQTVNSDRCQAARSEMAKYEFMLKQSGQEPSEAVRDHMARLQQIIDESCPK